LRPSIIIADAVSGFSDPDFWGPYNLIEPDKSIEIAIEKIRKKLEREN
ncbi:MAG TPA: carboxypeptidase-like regulatory domain-containing protein, partial [Flavobacteriaceae bacterium]